MWAQAWAATEEVTLVIEACGSRCNLPDVPAGGSTFQRVADGGIGSHVVLGPTFNAAAAQAADLGGVEIELSVNGEVKVNTTRLLTIFLAGLCFHNPMPRCVSGERLRRGGV